MKAEGPFRRGLILILVVATLLLSGSCTDQPTPPDGDSPASWIPVPELATPENNAFLQSARADLSWRDSSVYNAFSFEVATYQDFRHADTSGTLRDTSAVVMIRSPLLWHYWRVRGRDVNNTAGPWSPARRFYAWATYGGSGEDGGNDVQLAAGGGYMVLGYTASIGAGGFDIYLVRTDSGGNVIWTRTIGGSADDVGRSFEQTPDGGTIITGYTKSIGAGEADVYLVKTDPHGNVSWSKTYGGRNNDDGASVHRTTDGGYVVVGTTSREPQYPDVYLIKTDAGGDTLWTRMIGGDRPEGGSSILQTNDGGYAIAGWSYPSAATYVDAYLIRTNAFGDTLWTRTFGGSGEDGALDVQMTSDNGFVLSGYTRSFGAGPRVYLIKVDSTGKALWTRTLGGTSDLGYSVQQTPDGGYVIAGSSYTGGSAAFLLKTDASGNQIWRKTFGGRQYDFAQSVLATPDGGYIMAGYGSSFGDGSYDAFLIKTDADGNVWGR